MNEPVELVQREMTLRDLNAVNAMWPRRYRPLRRKEFLRDKAEPQRFHRVFEAGPNSLRAMRRVYGGDAVPTIAAFLSGGVWSQSSLRHPDRGFSISLHHWMVHPIWQHRGIGRQMFEGLRAQLNSEVRTIHVTAFEVELAFFLFRMGFQCRAHNVAYTLEGVTENIAHYAFEYPPGSSGEGVGRIVEFRMQAPDWSAPAAPEVYDPEDE